MTRIMYDSITAADIPATATIVGGYVNGTFQWSAADWARFPNAVHVRFATRANVNDGNTLDVEKGDATPDEAPGWVEMRRNAGVDPTVYCGEASWDSVRAAFVAAGVPEPHYMIAHYDNVPTVPIGAVAKQYINDPASGGHYDLSAVADYWPGIDPAPIPVHTKEIDMIERELRPTANGSVTLIVPVDADELVISLGWTHADVLKIAFFGPTPGMAPPAVDQLWSTTGTQRDDAARPWRIPLAPARAKGEVLTCEVDYVLTPLPGRDVTGAAGFRKYA